MLANFGTGTVSMQIIPVLDLKAGTVVRARLGERAHYRPIETPLARTSDPVDVARGLLSLYPFDALYVADLDAIEGRHGHDAVLAQVAAAFPHLRLWVDNGICQLPRASDWLALRLGDLVLGSESQTDAALVRALAGDARIALSLDFRGGDFQGPPELLADPACWPQRVIVMTLARVGSGAGPDLERLASVQAAAPGKSLYAAGGVRDAADLTELKGRGIAGALVATALHDGRLNGLGLARLREYP
jgi:phosphoribosylformimino-5-aminoimidazole carboxamide ribotide isomerase